MTKNYSPTKFGILAGISFILTIMIAGGIYAAWTDIGLLKVNPNDVLNSGTWNNAMDNFELLRNSQSVPAGGVLSFALQECPEGWSPANGENGTPDLRGRFIRGLNSFENGANLGYESDGTTLRDSNKGVARTLMSYQEDAIRNITGEFRVNSYVHTAYGAIYHSGVGGYTGGNSAHSLDGWYYFDASREVPVGDDNHPKNVALIYCVKD